ncbi:unnamed protein product [Bursaphelenchus okinawaensis]|uniref:TPR_REGION domain-containing protein n=1 Tax=Bursaphelenchus okinawaensis TaxID=465554 RepID=A0A811LN56_9BILA|nr:unnamed protein product [Bursaphelenchus okinawaensis]CAG9125771.1 unnamed protein product [Bursaphelenchus okinawaensis]
MAKVYGTKSVEEALKHLAKVAESNPNDPFAWQAIGLQFHAIRCYQDALTYFLKAEQIKANISASNLYYIGDCLRRIGAIDEAQIYFKRALTVPVRNRVDQKGFAAAKKYLLSHGYTESEFKKPIRKMSSVN